MTFTPLRMTGMCRNGAERDGGALFHAVASAVPPGGSWDKALCGAQPGARGNGWNATPGEAVTCPKCLKKLAADAPPALNTVNLRDLPGLPGDTKAVSISSVTQATKWLRKEYAVSAAGPCGAINVWQADGQWRAHFQQYRRVVSEIGCNHLAAVVEWLKEWLPRCAEAPQENPR